MSNERKSLDAGTRTPAAATTSLGHDLGLAILAVVLFVASFHPWNLGWLAFGAVTPWLLLLERTSLRRLLWLVPLIALAQYFAGLYWIWLVTPEGLAISASVCAVYLLCLSLAVRAVRRHLGLPLWLAAPPMWVAVEYFRGAFTFCKFPWLFLGHTQHGVWPLLQTADLWGIYGISFLVAMVGAAAADLLEQRRLGRLRGPQTRSRIARVIAAPFLLGMAAMLYGIARPHTITLEPGPAVLLVQPSIPQNLKNQDNDLTADKIFVRHLLLTAEGLLAWPETDLVVWSETMVFWPVNEQYPSYDGWWQAWLDAAAEQDRAAADARDPRQRSFHQRSAMARRRFYTWAREGDRQLHALAQGQLAGVLEALVSRGSLDSTNAEQARSLAARLRAIWPQGRGVDLMVGAMDRTNPKRDHNSIYMIDRAGNTTGRYDKINLVPMSEYVPFEASWPWLHAFLRSFIPPDFASFEPGRSPAVFEVGPPGRRHRVSPHICFEVSFPELCRDQVAAGAETLVSLSNDAWFQQTAELDLTRAHAIFRCVETRRGMARAVNAGISSIVDPLGRVQDLIVDGRRKEVSGVLGGVVVTSSVGTPMMALGDAFVQLLTGVALALTAVAVVKSLRGQH